MLTVPEEEMLQTMMSICVTYIILAEEQQIFSDVV
jgi:hypothetical protein